MSRDKFELDKEAWDLFLASYGTNLADPDGLEAAELANCAYHAARAFRAERRKQTTKGRKGE